MPNTSEDGERLYFLIKLILGISLVVQWLRLSVSNAGAQLWSLVRKIDSTCYNWKIPHVSTKTQESQINQSSSVAQSRPTLCDPMDCNSPSSSIHGIIQARILEWVTMPISRGSSQPKDWIQVSLIAGGFFTTWGTKEVCNQAACAQILSLTSDSCVTPDSLTSLDFSFFICKGG